MEVKSGEGARHRRKVRDEEDKWECSVCTYINPSESYKCEICFMRKGTSTRKPRLNPQVLEQQQFIAQTILKEKDDEHRKKKSERVPEKSISREPNIKLKNFDRSSPMLFEIFANGYSVIITEFPPKSKGKAIHFPDSPAASNCSSLLGFSGTASAAPDQLSPTDSNSNSDALSRAFQFVDGEFSDGTDSKTKVCSVIAGKSTHVIHARTAIVPSCNEHVPSLVRSHSFVSNSTEAAFPTGSSSPIPPPSSSSGFSQKRDLPESVQSSLFVGGSSDVKASKKLARRNLIRKSITVGDTRLVPSRLAKSNFRSNLSAKRLPSSNDMKLVISSRQKRPISDDLKRSRTSPATPAKRRKIVLSRSGPRKSNTRNRRAHSSGAIGTHEECFPVKSTSTRIHLKENVSPVELKKIPSNKRYSSTPLELKCKIRMAHPTDPSVASSVFNNEKHLKTSHTLISMDSTGELSKNGDNADSPDRSMSESGDAVLNNPSRLSVESKSTSAMTDSAGATALEMSG